MRKKRTWIKRRFYTKWKRAGRCLKPWIFYRNILMTQQNVTNLGTNGPKCREATAEIVNATAMSKTFVPNKDNMRNVSWKVTRMLNEYQEQLRARQYVIAPYRNFVALLLVFLKCRKPPYQNKTQAENLWNLTRISPNCLSQRGISSPKLCETTRIWPKLIIRLMR